MKPHPRIRKFFRWGGLVGSIFLFIIWIGSAFVECWYTYRGEHHWFLDSGCVSYRYFPVAGNSSTSKMRCRSMAAPKITWSSQLVPTKVGWHVRLPLWPFVLVSTGVTAAAWRMDTLAQRRKRLGGCPACGYDRAGLAADAPCPECNAKA